MRLPAALRGTRPLPPYKILSVLLQYPDERLNGAHEELDAAVNALGPSAARASILEFWRLWRSTPPEQRAQRYVATFDLHRKTSLYLTYFLYGDTRKRGSALVRLKQMYAAAGFPVATGELPDYLPLMLEFAAVAPREYGETVLDESRASLELLRLALRDQRSPYVHLVDAVCAGLRSLSPLELEQMGTIAAEGPPREQVGLEPFAPPEVVPRVGARR